MPPLTIMMKPASGACNLRCGYCFYADVAANRQVGSYGLMSTGTLDKIVRRAFAYAEGQLSFIFQGGEPLLAGKAFFRHFSEEMRAYAHKPVRVSCAVQTNATLIDEEWCRIFKEGGFLVGVSLDGDAQTHDLYRRDPSGAPTYARVRSGIELLKAAGVEFNALCVVTRQISLRPEATFEALREYGYIQFIPCLDHFDGCKAEFSLDAEEYGAFLIKTWDLYEKALFTPHPVSVRSFDNWLNMLLGRPPESCAMSGRCGQYYLIEADGGVYPCDFYVLDRWRLGNINETGFRALAESELGQAFRAESLPVHEKCRACPWFFLCRGGCKREREPIAEGAPSLNRLCAGHKRFFEARYENMKQAALRLSRLPASGAQR